MSQTAAQINQEIRDRINRGTEISESRVYDWMNRVKHRAQTAGSPLDFMYHEALLLLGGGTGIPGVATAQLRFSSDTVILPPNFHTLRSAKIYTGDVITGDDSGRIYGDTETPSLVTFPSTCTAGDGYSTDHVALEADLYPLFANDDSVFEEEFSDRNVTITTDDMFAESVDCRIVSREAGAFVSDATNTLSAPVVAVGLDSFSENPKRTAQATAMTSEGYAVGPWSGKILTVVNYEAYFGVETGAPNFRAIELGYYRTLPDYNERSWENLTAPIPTEDVFTRTAADLLIKGTMRQAYEYLNQFDQMQVWAGLERVEMLDFRRRHRASQSQAGFDELRRVREGTRVVRA